MNAAIRSVVRSALSTGARLSSAAAGLIAGAFRSSTIATSAGSHAGDHARQRAMKSSRPRQGATSSSGERASMRWSIEATIGRCERAGDGGFTVVGVGSTIDNDVRGADISIGVDTALGVALESIDRLKVTASSHRRAFVIEVMGRKSGYLALMSGIAGGAEAIVIPEEPATVAR
jgi:6-phosphofructokinase 1